MVTCDTITISNVISNLETYYGDQHEFCIQKDSEQHCADAG